MDVIILPLERLQRCLEVRADARKYHVQVGKNFFCPYAATVFCHEDQMNMRQENTIPATPGLDIVARP